MNMYIYIYTHTCICMCECMNPRGTPGASQSTARTAALVYVCVEIHIDCIYVCIYVNT